jgi:exopolyphosphatase/guanosine-5'-triphosphate,3'-diphosphate pyrophosphatase
VTSHAPVVAAIDIGSNTIKLTVARLGDGLPEVIESRAEVVRLSEGLALTGRIRPDRLERAVAVLTDLGGRARELGARRIDAVATEATRAASNGPAFLDRVRDATGIEVRVISGAEEAELTAEGVLAQIDPAGRVLIVDIGGGSTELIETQDGLTLRSVSIPLGSGRMTDLLVASDPPAAAELDAVAAATREQAGSFLDGGERGGKLVLVGGAGEYLMIVSGSANPIPLGALEVARERSLELSAAQMAAVSGAPLARARVLPAGFAIARTIAGLSAPGHIESVGNGLRIGLLLRMSGTRT